ncbi:homophilic cell adhesion via plasma membrane adhesion molecules, partial [Pristimantis euphronides]
MAGLQLQEGQSMQGLRWQSSEPSLFTIDQHTGEIRTSRAFQERDIMKHGTVVLVKDNGSPSRSASVTINMVIADHFHQVLPELSNQSNKEESQSNLQFYLVIALALISFLFMLTVIIAVVAKYKESKSSTPFGSMSTSLYPPVDPRFLSQFKSGTLPLPYSYDVCVTLDPSEQEFAFLQPQHNVPVESLIDADDSGIGNETLKNSSPAENLILQSYFLEGTLVLHCPLSEPVTYYKHHKLNYGAYSRGGEESKNVIFSLHSVSRRGQCLGFLVTLFTSPVAVPHIRLRAPLFTNKENILQIQNRLHDADSAQLQEETQHFTL